MASHDASHHPRLGRMSDLDDFQVADGYPDIRGWSVKTADGTTIGKVDDLVIDTQALRVRYLDVDLDRSLRDRVQDAAASIGAKDAAALGARADEGHTLLPIGDVQVDDEHDDIIVSGMTADAIGALPRRAHTSFDGDHERSVRDRLFGGGATTATGTAGAAAAGIAGGAMHTHGSDDFDYDTHERFDDQRLFANRRAMRQDTEQRVTLAEEQLAVGKRQTQAGQVELRKEVDVERVQERVPVTHEEVHVDRRPITAADAVPNATMGEEHIRVPVMREEVVAEKRIVPREEIIVRKQAVTEQRTVQGEVRREHLAVDDAGARASGLVHDANDRTLGSDRNDPLDRR